LSRSTELWISRVAAVEARFELDLTAADRVFRGERQIGFQTMPADDLILPIAEPGDAALTEDLALARLKHPDLPPEALEALSRNASLMKSRKVRLALVSHPRTPRHVSLPMVRHLFTFDLMRVALTPVVPANLKLAADQVLINRLETLASGERLTLARRASGKVAGALLADVETRVMATALENSRLTEAALITALTRQDAPAALVEAVSRHPKWSVRREVRVALLGNSRTPMARALEFARSLPPTVLHEILNRSRLPSNLQSYLRKELNRRG